MSESEIDYDLVSFVIRSDYRDTVIQCLNQRPMTPTQIVEATDIEIAHVSRALTQMREKGLVKLLVSDDVKKGRIYDISEKGEQVNEHIEGGAYE